MRAYFYNKHTKIFKFDGELGLDVPMPKEGATCIPVVLQEGFFSYFDEDIQEWKQIAHKVYMINSNGFLEDIKPGDQVLNEHTGHFPDNCIQTPIPAGYTVPRWNGSAWEDRLVPASILSPVWNSSALRWEEGLSSEDYNREIDKQTSDLVKQWCRDQTKNEDYYINRGILYGKDDPEYQEYVTVKAQIINSQKLIKKEV